MRLLPLRRPSRSRNVRRDGVNLNLAVALSRLSLAIFVAALGSALAAGVAAAHFEVDVGDGKYVMEIGFRDEPAYVGQPNAVFLHVAEYATGGTQPVDGLAATLTAEVTKDGQSLTPPLVPTGDGSYQAIFIPTATGDYTFRISGTIGDAPVDETVTSSPTTFDSVQPAERIAFPASQANGPSPADLAQNAQADAAMARNLGIAGIVVGVLGLLVAAIALARAGKASPPAPEAARPIEPTGKLIK